MKEIQKFKKFIETYHIIEIFLVLFVMMLIVLLASKYVFANDTIGLASQLECNTLKHHIILNKHEIATLKKQIIEQNEIIEKFTAKQERTQTAIIVENLYFSVGVTVILLYCAIVVTAYN